MSMQGRLAGDSEARADELEEALQQTTEQLCEKQLELDIETAKLNNAQEQCQALAALVNVTLRRLLSTNSTPSPIADQAIETTNGVQNNCGGSQGVHESIPLEEEHSIPSRTNNRGTQLPISDATRSFLSSDSRAIEASESGVDATSQPLSTAGVTGVCTSTIVGHVMSHLFVSSVLSLLSGVGTDASLTGV